MATGYALPIAAALFGSTSWLCINAAWMELSLLMRDMPEGYVLPSYLDVIVQIACGLVLIVSTLAQRYCSNTVIGLSRLISALLIICCVSQLGLALFWTEATPIFGASHSLTAFLFVFALGCVSAASNVVFMPYMARFHSTALGAYFVGIGLSALVPSLISLIQGTLQYDCVANGTVVAPVFQETRFSVRTYFLIIFVWLGAGAAAFVSLNWFPQLILSDRVQDGTSRSSSRLSYDVSKMPKNSLPPPALERASTFRYVVLLTCLVLASAEMNSIVMSIQIYLALPYSLFTYHMSLTLSATAQSVFCLLPMWIRPRSLVVVVGLTAMSTVICGYIVGSALMSPTPPLHDQAIGGIIAVFASVASFALNSYLRTLITSTISEEAMAASNHCKPTSDEKNVWTSGHDDRRVYEYDREREENAKRRLFWCGALMQLGSTFGSLIMFPLINVAHLFTIAPFCS